ncbi:MAG: hypothetical protein R6V53_07210 [Candidatus Woesearchaeota archaeon]
MAKGNVGIGTLILFITILMVTAVAVIVLMQTSGVISQGSHQTTEQTRKDIGTGLEINEIILEKENGEYTRLIKTIKLAPGSEIIEFNDTIITIGLDDTSTNLQYRKGGQKERSINGYITPRTENIEPLGYYHEEGGSILLGSWTSLGNVDLDLDGNPDYVKVCNGESFCSGYGRDYLVFNLSSESFTFVHLENISGGSVDPSSSSHGGEMDMDKPIGDYGRITINGTPCDVCGDLRDSDVDIDYYNNRAELANDLDNDGNPDYVHINNTHAIFTFSTGTTTNISFGDISSAPQTLDVTTSVQDATLDISGTTQTDYVLDNNVDMMITPENNNGYYIVDYIKRGNNYQEGILGPRDVATLYFETPAPITHGDTIKISIIPPNGAAFTKTITTKDALEENSISLYP